MTTVLNGVIGGVVAALVAAGADTFVTDHPSPGAEVLALVLGGSVGRSRLATGILYVSYGGSAGGGLVALDPFVFGVLGVPPPVWEALGIAVGWSAVLLVAVTVVRHLHPRLRERIFIGPLIAFHLVFGLGLGVWIRLTWIT